MILLPDFANVYESDAVEGMKQLKPGSVHCIITDPPFAISFNGKPGNYNRKSSNVIHGYADIPKLQYPSFTVGWMTEASRVLAEDGSMFVFSGWNNLKAILDAGELLGLTIVNHIIWKYQFGVVCKRRFVTSHYHILYFCKNDKKRRFFNSARYTSKDITATNGSKRYRDMEDVFVINREYWTGRIKTPTKLPLALIEKLLAYTTLPNDLVLDPFIGSGQVAIASIKMGRKCIGFEIVPEYVQFSTERICKALV